jgi:hypothetical protein
LGISLYATEKTYNPSYAMDVSMTRGIPSH